ncbi:PDZ and LIM domain protein Zasp [Gryllus bimaculatus]|nr:PDZ and LIM domain protein Zasp [Gryllus bimaculatus]
MRETPFPLDLREFSLPPPPPPGCSPVARDVAHPEPQRVSRLPPLGAASPPPSAQVVHKQFNSPIGLYSDQNIAETIQSQTGATPLKKTYVYDPSKSETFKALKESEFGEEVQEMSQPVQPKVFTPQVNKNVHFKKPVSAPHQTYVNSLGNTADNIQQSGSFRRLMNAVLGESEY